MQCLWVEWWIWSKAELNEVNNGMVEGISQMKRNIYELFIRFIRTIFEKIAVTIFFQINYFTLFY